MKTINIPYEEYLEMERVYNVFKPAKYKMMEESCVEMVMLPTGKRQLNLMNRKDLIELIIGTSSYYDDVESICIVR